MCKNKGNISTTLLRYFQFQSSEKNHFNSQPFFKLNYFDEINHAGVPSLVTYW